MRAALREDRARGDVTSRYFIPLQARGRAALVAREPGVLAGVQAAEEAFRSLDRRVRTVSRSRDGRTVRPGQAVLVLEGRLRSLLAAERTALNTLSHLSGIATLTRRFVHAAGGLLVLDTRKTLPGLRDMEKYAVRCGGGVNHRRDLAAAVLIKENHLAFFQGSAGRSRFLRRVATARRRGETVEMECRNRAEAVLGLDAGVDILLLDNIPLRRLTAFVRDLRAECRRRGRRRPLLEVSGGVDVGALRRIARAGVDRVSVGRLTHSAPALDMNLDVERIFP